MLPQSYELPVALVLMAAGALACVAGYRLFRIVLAIFGFILGAMLLQRYVIIVATAFGGAWTVIVGGLAIATDRATTRGAPSGDVWILYPTGASGRGWVPIAWIVLGLVGTALQLGVTGRKKK